ncbi:chemotaxis protein CheW [Haloimpatiens lingqiaonensis]|uniref:chemotaxis protein CheW n=1 Tax=Haloimpatiens lingqiaonensis TaxID=1380675 RepID=UPI0010FE6339|nr:chemotaxis protein CheW [Haloimpatiens lingqiaonensis]
MQVVIFKLQDEEFAVETAKIQSITDTMEITRVPKAPNYIKGLINLRGNIIPLLNLKMLLDIEINDIEQENIIIVSINEESIGIIVDMVEEVLEIEENIIENLNEKDKKEYIKGIINFKDRIVTLIDIDKLVLN